MKEKSFIEGSIVECSFFVTNFHVEGSAISRKAYSLTESTVLLALK